MFVKFFSGGGQNKFGRQLPPYPPWLRRL